MLGNLVAQSPDLGRAELDIPHRSLAQRNGPGDARISRIEDAAYLYTFAPARTATLMAAIIDSAMTSVRKRAERIFAVARRS
jgi:hypothetical protein